MREQLMQYVDALFAGAPEAGEVKQEILQNTLDRYDDLIAQGKSPEAAYRLAVEGIGDVSEILGGNKRVWEPAAPQEDKKAKLLRAISTGLYITCPIPLFVIDNDWGLCLLLVFVAAATVLRSLAGKRPEAPREETKRSAESDSPKRELRRSIRTIVWAVGLVFYLILSMVSQAWYITWLMFPIIGCVNGLINACLDLREEI